MTLFGLPLTTLYFNVLIIVGAITIIYVLFSDVFHGMFDFGDSFNPTVVLAFITLFSAGGFALEKATSWSSTVIAVVSIIASLILVTILNVFVLIPIKNAEQSLAYTDESLIGREGEVIIPIPANGFGQVMIKSNTGLITKAAIGPENVEITMNTKIVVIGVKPGTLIVKASEDK